MKINFIKKEERREFVHTYQIKKNNEEYYFCIKGMYDPSPLLDQEHWLYFDSLEESEVQIFQTDSLGEIGEIHPLHNQGGEKKDSFLYYDAWEKLMDYYKNFLPSQSLESKYFNISELLKKEIEMLKNPLMDKTVMVSNDKELDIYQVGRLDAYQDLLTILAVNAINDEKIL